MYDYKLIRSKRKTLSLEIKRDLSIVVRAPVQVDLKYIQSFVKSRETWIDKHLKSMKKFLGENGNENENAVKFTQSELKDLVEKAKSIIPERVEHYAETIGVDYGRITVRKQVSRWGSCSSNGNLNFNCLLVLVPTDVMDYVIVHELCHRKHLNHSPEFWAEVEKILPDYRTRKKWLKDNGIKLVNRLRA